MTSFYILLHAFEAFAAAFVLGVAAVILAEDDDDDDRDGGILQPCYVNR
jgi:hypothetical protein